MTENERKLREALAAILPVKDISGHGARAIAHKTLRDLYGNDIPGATLQECDAWMDEEMKRITADLVREAREWVENHPNER